MQSIETCPATNSLQNLNYIRNSCYKFFSLILEIWSTPSFEHYAVSTSGKSFWERTQKCSWFIYRYFCCYLCRCQESGWWCTKSFENAIEKEQFNWHGDFVFQSEEEAKEKIKENLEKHFLSEKVRKYVLATGIKNFYSLQHFFSIIDL